MKILILTNNDVGLYKFRKELLEVLLKENEVYICLPYGHYVDQMKQMGCQFIDTEFNRKGMNPFKDFALLRNYHRIIRSVKPDIVFTYTIKPNVYGGIACQMNKVRYVANITGLGTVLENGGILQRIASMLYRIGLKGAQRIFFQNQANMSFMNERKIVRNNGKIIPGSGVNLKMYHPLEYPEEKPIGFVYVGRMMKEKGFGLYLDAAEYIHQEYPDTVFHVCGPDEDDYLQKVIRLEKQGVIRYHGMVEDMVEIYRQVQCIVHPSYYAEGMSNVLLEAAACGRMLITTDRPGCREIVDDGINGYLIKQNDLEDLIEKIGKVVQMNYEDRIAMGKEGRKKVEKEFDRKLVIDSYIEELKNA